MQTEIYRIEDYRSGRKLVFLDEGAPAFCLYSKEVKKFELKEGMKISDELYGELVTLLSKRARERCLYLLDDMARTEYQLRKKLEGDHYPEEAIDNAVSYCREKHYIDDEDYAKRYISSKSASLSRRMMEKKLMEKGISREIISEAFEDVPVCETETVRSLIEKKYGDTSGLSFEERQKIIRRFANAGFAYDAVRQAFDHD